MRLILVILLSILPAATKKPHVTFTNRVWARADSTGNANGDRYTFLSTGTFVITSSHGHPSFGYWKPEGNGFLIYENGIRHSASVLSLSATKLRLRFEIWDRTLDVPFTLVDPAEPDTLLQYEGFNPGAFRVEARGSEPSWRFYVEGGHAEMDSEFKSGTYEHGIWKQNQTEDRIWTFTAKSTDGTEALLTIIETPTPCTDADYQPGDYVMEAHLQAGGNWVGCALLSRLIK